VAPSRRSSRRDQPDPLNRLGFNVLTRTRPRPGARRLWPRPRRDAGRGKKTRRRSAWAYLCGRSSRAAEPHRNAKKPQPKVAPNGAHLAAECHSTKYQTQAQQPEQAHEALVVVCLGHTTPPSVRGAANSSGPPRHVKTRSPRTSLVKTSSWTHSRPPGRKASVNEDGVIM
jgi:hypothetical protein